MVYFAPQDHARVVAVAKAGYVAPASWVRAAVMRAVEAAEVNATSKGAT
jgi:hypothetical protein